jgi:hypothetical protein
MTLFVAVVSHGHEALIGDNTELQALAGRDCVEVVIRDNLGCTELRNLALGYSMHYLAAPSPMGFGANNNAVFEYCRSRLGMQPGDYFCLHNPSRKRRGFFLPLGHVARRRSRPSFPLL